MLINDKNVIHCSASKIFRRYSVTSSHSTKTHCHLPKEDWWNQKEGEYGIDAFDVRWIRPCLDGNVVTCSCVHFNSIRCKCMFDTECSLHRYLNSCHIRVAGDVLTFFVENQSILVGHLCIRWSSKIWNEKRSQAREDALAHIALIIYQSQIDQIIHFLTKPFLAVISTPHRPPRMATEIQIEKTETKIKRKCNKKKIKTKITSNNNNNSSSN